MSESANNRPLPGPVVALTALWAFSLTGLVTAGLILYLEQAAAYHCSDTIANVCRASWLSTLLPIFDCDILFESPLARPFGAPLTLYAAAYYLVSLFLALTLLVTRTGTPFRNAIEWVVAVSGALLLLLTVGLVSYSVLVFHAICRVCLLFYVINTALCLAARLIVPRRWTTPTKRGERPLQNELNRYTDRVLALLLAAIALFTTSAIAHAAFLRWDNHLRTHPEESRCRNFPAPNVKTPLRLGPGIHTPNRLMAIIDPACTQCRREWPEMKRWAHAGLPLLIYLNPKDEACNLKDSESISGTHDSRKYRACAASKALWCMGNRHPEHIEAYLERLYDLQGRTVTDEQLLDEASRVGLTTEQASQLRTCIDAESTLHAIDAHRTVAVGVEASGTPFFALLHGETGHELPRNPDVRERILEPLSNKENL